MAPLITMKDEMIRVDQRLDIPPPSPAQRRVGCWITARGSQEKRHRGGCRGRTLPHWALVVVDEGEGWFESRPSGRIALTAPCLLWLVPGVAHSYAAEPTWSERWLMADGSLLDELAASGAMSAAEPAHHLPAGSTGARAFDRCWRALDRSHPLAMPQAAAALHELAVASHIRRLGYGTRQQPQDRLVAAAIAAIQAPGGEDRAPGAIARELGVAYSTLRRRFRAVTGGSLRDWAIARRLARAKELLRADDQPIKTVATACGFDDPYYFSRLFARRVGVSPSTFRERGSL